jgi:predicted permease
LPKAFWDGADRLTYYIFLPALLVHSIATANLVDVPFGDGIFVGMLSVLLATGLLAAKRQTMGYRGPAFTSVLQGAIRPNTYIGLALAFALYDEAAPGPVAVAIIAFIPLVNIVSAGGLAILGKPSKEGQHRTPGIRVLLNPLLIACAAGIAVNVADAGLPPVAEPLLSVLGRAALPIGLLAVGAGLVFKDLGKHPGPIALAALYKLILLPLFAVVLFNLFGIAGPTPAVVALFAAAPASVSSYILARQMGGDARLMAAIITAETLVAFVTIPLWMYLKDFFV